MNTEIENTTTSIRNSLFAKGRILVNNNSIALTGMAEDNAFMAIQALVSSTVLQDEDIQYGIYMDNSRVPWVYASCENPEGFPQSRDPMEDSMSVWVSGLNEASDREFLHENMEIIEFAAPVESHGEVLGYIRYGFSTESIRASIESAVAEGNRSRIRIILFLIALCLLSLAAGFITTKHLASQITRPIDSLVESTRIISNGEYDHSIVSESNDEIGNLARHFEIMRSTIKKYTDHLQDLIDEKMQQVNDILNNIDQGLFTINLDGTVNKEYSARANEILKVEDISSHSVNELLRLDSKENDSFKKWLALVKKRHNVNKWKKLVRLAPVHELELVASEQSEQEYVSISYQKIYDKEGKLSKIMILAMDETEKHLREIQMKKERAAHENEVKMILSITNTSPDEIAEFMEDTTTRLEKSKEMIQKHLNSSIKERKDYPSAIPYVITDEDINKLYRNLHTIKGNGGTYGFDMLSEYAHVAESMLEQLRAPAEIRKSDILLNLMEMVKNIEVQIEEVHKKIRMIFGKDDQFTIKVPVSRVDSINEICESISQEKVPKNVKALIYECERLSWKPLKELVRKYQKICQKTARKTHKNVEFTVKDERMIYSSDELNDIDDILIHLFRNCVDHGIENPEVREELGKGKGKIQLIYNVKKEIREITVSDDGKGIDTEKLVETCVQKGIVKNDDVKNYSENECLNLIFKPGVSTSEKISDISGRGMGMDIVYEKVKSLDGEITITSAIGKGTTFYIKIPKG
ncbi:ATP-binding protein [Chitinispirillales bacterium ANBcel5]|uniref:ATP-binding protein n=1 Tax=Cellulosispirillum alkaliphilum TaxID=3039283 RepID=UPI002A5152B4|nr:ATP-binding protein [Chitinispirillales bacterium ANBcel5]